MGQRRLTVLELDNTVRDLLGDSSRPALTWMPEDRLTPFDNDFTLQQPSRVLVESAESMARDVAQRLIADPARRDSIVGCTPAAAVDDSCMTQFVTRFGRLALRRALSETEISELMALGSEYSADSAGGFDTGVEVVLRTMLQSPFFLYRIEVGTPVPEQPGMFRLDGYELASRLSFLIWASAPDGALLDAAEAGALDTAEGRRQEAARMLDDDRARRQVDRFHAMWLSYDQMPLAADLTSRMRAETSALIERVVFDEQRSWLDLFTATETYIDDTLAAHYGLQSPGSAQPAWVDVSASGRQGILSQGAFLSAASNPADTSPTKRGKLVRERLLCEKIPPPDPDAPADMPPDPSFGNCKVDQYAANRAQGASCKGCHERLDFVGFGLENYDMAGRFRTHDDGKPECTIDGMGEVQGLGSFRGPAELSSLLVNSGELDACAVEQWYRFAMGRAGSSQDRALLTALEGGFKDSGHRFRELVLALASHEGFRYRLEMTP